MADTEQRASGADENALRNNIEIGESKVYTIKAAEGVGGQDSGYALITVEVEEGDDDRDNCKVAEGFTPVAGEKALFTRTAEHLTVSAVPEGDGEEGKTR